MKSFNNIVIFFTFFCSLTASLFSLSVNTGEFPNKSPEEVNTIVLKTLDKLGSNYKLQEKTNGFTFRYINPFFNLYQFDIYIGEYKSGSMVRIESIDNTNNALLSAITTEAYNTKFPFTHHEKNIFVGDILSFVLPAAGSIYTNIDSPLNMKYSWLFSILFLGIDGGLFWAGSTTFFTHSFDPLRTGLIPTIALMGTYRVAYTLINHFSIVANNKMINLGYTFQFD
ncbi:MAG: hypothetical protein OEV78_06745 [Spirochaetia bacterium]|nr:hypothetical protein [Spirochaetia bacterium]